jgi:hypothetical protein
MLSKRDCTRLLYKIYCLIQVKRKRKLQNLLPMPIRKLGESNAKSSLHDLLPPPPIHTHTFLHLVQSRYMMIDFPQCSGSGPRWPDPDPHIHNTGMDLDPTLGPSLKFLQYP